MDKNAIRKYAVWARNELIARVTQKAEQYEITELKTTSPDADSIGERVLTATEKKQRQALIAKINHDGFGQVMEEVAYTWFNRFTALRFMEVNNYLPSHTRIFTNESGEFKPQILADAIQLELDGLNMDKVYELKNANKTEDLYKYLLIVQCNALSNILPGMFQRIEDYTELLLPDYLLREGSIIERLVAEIPEDNFDISSENGQVEIIGWLYQYYISEKHEDVIKAVGKVAVTKNDVPAATQLFTPDWIVHYMVENSLGRLWLEGHPDNELKTEWKYYLEECRQEETVDSQLDELRKEYAAQKPEDILCIDPCMGSGHILCVLFDVLVRIYENYGYSAREAVSSIVEKNIWGLDIDERAAQLSYFTVMMKARQYDRRFFSRGIQPNVFSVRESNEIDKYAIDFFCGNNNDIRKSIETILSEMRDAKEYGSMIETSSQPWDLLYSRFAELNQEISMYSTIIKDELLPLVKSAQALSQKYDVCVTNPPYLSRMSAALKNYVLKNYADYSGDMFAVFVIRDLRFCKPNGFSAMMTPNVWLFIKTYEKLREQIVNTKSISSLVQLAKGSFFREAAVDIVTFVLSNRYMKDYKGKYVRLEDFKADMDVQKEKLLEAAHNPDSHYIYNPSMASFKNIEATPIAYWCTDALYKHFLDSPKLASISAPRQGLATADNNRFLRLWHELRLSDIGFGRTSCDDALASGYKWFPYNKGGAFRRWYGNRDYVVNWKNDGYEIKNFKDANGKVRSRPQNLQFYFHQSITWSDITSGSFSGRYSETGSIFDVQGSSAFPKDDVLFYMLGFMNSSVSQAILKMLNPTLHTQVGDLSRLPVVVDESRKAYVESLVKECVNAAREDWNSHENSWDYQTPFCKNNYELVKDEIAAIGNEQKRRFEDQKEREVKINQAFIEIYGLQGEMDASVNDEDVTLSLPDELRTTKELISYAVGCMFGRYSTERDGIVYAGGEWDDSQYGLFTPDKDGIIPICDDEYFEDDIVNRFVQFIKIAYGQKNLESNLQYIANVLNGNGTAREVIRNYFLSDFYIDHCSMCSVTGSGKRPFYWLFDSGKKNGFKCLVYMHRYKADTIARIRTDYVHEQQSRYRTAISNLEQRVSGAASERVKLNKRLVTLQAQATEIREYEEKIHHLADQMISIDLDDGVKHNYEIFKDVLAKIK